MKLHLSFLLAFIILNFASCQKSDVFFKNLLNHEVTSPAGGLGPRVNLLDGLVAYYPFDGNANDESGNGNDGVAFNTTLTADRKNKKNSAYYFNGVDAYIDAGTAGMTADLNTFSFSVWVYVDALSKGGVIMTKRHRDSDPGYIGPVWATLSISNDYTASFLVDAPGYINDITGGSALLDNSEWHNVIGIKSETAYALYIDGVLINRIDDSTPINSELNMHIGHHGAWRNFFSGKIDDVRIYDCVLNKFEIAFLAKH
jgi:hypothetical protein